MGYSDYVNKDIPWSQFNRVAIFSSNADSLSSYPNADIGPFYFSTEYVNFSDESVLNLFVDALNYPLNLQSAIDDGLIPNPIIYLPFDDPSNFGKNLGTGSDFTVSGTLRSGSDVSPP